MVGEAPVLNQSTSDFFPGGPKHVLYHLPAREGDPFQLTCPIVQCTAGFFFGVFLASLVNGVSGFLSFCLNLALSFEKIFRFLVKIADF